MQNLKLHLDNEITILSGESRVFKTGGFSEKLSRFKSADAFVFKLAEGVFSDAGFFLAEGGYFKASVGDNAYFFHIGTAKRADVGQKDIIFYDAEIKGAAERNDAGLARVLARPKTVVEYFRLSHGADADFNRLYRITDNDSVNFPLLDETQRKIVTAEDKNIVVQGVAGSGKTNVCIDKIIYSACRGYAGRILYTTFSRGLLMDTKARTDAFRVELTTFAENFRAGKIVFADKKHKQAIENKLGVYFSVDGDEEIAAECGRIAGFLSEKVDFFLIEDLFKKHVADKDATGEGYFTGEFLSDVKNHRLTARLKQMNELSYEIVFKEIYGVITGRYDPEKPADALSREQYYENRDFQRREAEVIYSLAEAYSAYLKEKGAENNNTMSRKLIESADSIEKYSVAIVDEVQDMTEVNLFMLKSISRKMFCVGDALQMINPSFFGFAYLKRLLFEKEVATVAELPNNYRSTKSISRIADSLSELNVKRFGTHSFVLASKAYGGESSAIVYARGGLCEKAADVGDATFIVSGVKSKEKLRKMLKKQEILTVSEAKGLERDNVVLCDILSDNADKWRLLERADINRKKADENSVYRYYFNLFYVGLTRARKNLFVTEIKEIPLFSDFFAENFKTEDGFSAAKLLKKVAGAAADTDEIIARISEFLGFGQYENARFAAEKINDGILREKYSVKIDVHERFIAHGRYREAGVEYWKRGLDGEAKEMFAMSGDERLSELVDACAEGGSKLGADVVSYYCEVADNEVARKLIVDTVKEDLADFKTKQKSINSALKNFKEKING